MDPPGTPARDEWPVAELYRIEPDDGFGERDDESETVVLSTPAPSEAPRRRLPGTATAFLAIALLLAAILLAAAISATRDDDRPAGVTATATPAAVSSPSTDTPAASSAKDTVPRVVGMPVAKATAAVEEAGLSVRVVRARSERPRGLVLRQEPREGAAAVRGDVVALVVSSGSPPVTTATVPSVVGRSAADAASELRHAGFVPRIRVVTAAVERAGIVVRQSPGEATEAVKGSRVRLDVSKGRRIAPRIDVPDLVGLDLTTARGRLAALGLTLEVVRQASAEPAGSVLRQSPQGNAQLPEKGRVTLTVSSGPERVEVPDVTGLDEQSARAQLEGAGFEVATSDEPTSDPTQDGSVLRQTPAGGSSLTAGSVVTIVVARLG